MSSSHREASNNQMVINQTNDDKLLGSYCRHHSLFCSNFIWCAIGSPCSSRVVHLMEIYGHVNEKNQILCEVFIPRISAYIITFQVSTGRSASLKLQSNFSAAIGSPEGSWYGETYSCSSDTEASIRFRGSKTSIFSRRSRAKHKWGLNLHEERALAIGIIGCQIRAEGNTLTLG